MLGRDRAEAHARAGQTVCQMHRHEPSYDTQKHCLPRLDEQRAQVVMERAVNMLMSHAIH